MPNDYFQFQQFRIEQSQCAMKVSTDACLLGAAADLRGARRVLDIGTGTGLLALMAAQRQPLATIEAIEIEPAAAAQAAANVMASPWADRIRVHPLSLAQFAATAPAPFDHVLCNPPFFQDSLLSQQAARRTARHASAASLPLAELASFATRFLTSAGRLTLLLPPPELRRFAAEAGPRGLLMQTDLQVRHRAGGRVTRHIAAFGRGLAPAPTDPRELLIQDAAGGYSADFKALLSGFYLHLEAESE